MSSSSPEVADMTGDQPIERTLTVAGPARTARRWGNRMASWSSMGATPKSGPWSSPTARPHGAVPNGGSRPGNPRARGRYLSARASIPPACPKSPQSSTPQRPLTSAIANARSNVLLNRCSTMSRRKTSSHTWGPENGPTHGERRGPGRPGSPVCGGTRPRLIFRQLARARRHCHRR